MGQEGGFYTLKCTGGGYLMTMQSHADFFYTAQNDLLNSLLLPTLLPPNEPRQRAMARLGQMRCLKKKRKEQGPESFQQ